MNEARHSELKAYLIKERQWFLEWQLPNDVSERLNKVVRVLRSDFRSHQGAFVLHREAKGLREMWVLAKCATILPITSIRLSATDPPDGYFQRDGLSFLAEVVEVIEPGRQRGKEYGPDVPAVSFDPAENWVRRADAIPGALSAEIAKKRLKSYPDSTELFVYLNIDEFGIRQKQIEAQIRSILRQPIAPFSAIHVRWKSKIYNSLGKTFSDPQALIEAEFDDDELWDSVLSDDE